jgi:hypothetical protein
VLASTRDTECGQHVVTLWIEESAAAHTETFAVTECGKTVMVERGADDPSKAQPGGGGDAAAGWTRLFPTDVPETPNTRVISMLNAAAKASQ